MTERMSSGIAKFGRIGKRTYTYAVKHYNYGSFFHFRHLFSLIIDIILILIGQYVKSNISIA